MRCACNQVIELYVNYALTHTGMIWKMVFCPSWRNNASRSPLPGERSMTFRTQSNTCWTCSSKVCAHIYVRMYVAPTLYKCYVFEICMWRTKGMHALNNVLLITYHTHMQIIYVHTPMQVNL